MFDGWGHKGKISTNGPSHYFTGQVVTTQAQDMMAQANRQAIPKETNMLAPWPPV